MGQKMADRHALIRIFRKEIRVLVVKSEFAFSDKEHDSCCRKLFGDRGHFKDAVLLHRQCILRISKAERAFTDDLSILGVKPCAVEYALFVCFTDKVFHSGLFIHDQILLTASERHRCRRLCLLLSPQNRMNGISFSPPYSPDHSRSSNTPLSRGETS